MTTPTTIKVNVDASDMEYFADALGNAATMLDLYRATLLKLLRQRGSQRPEEEDFSEDERRLIRELKEIALHGNAEHQDPVFRRVGLTTAYGVRCPYLPEQYAAAVVSWLRRIAMKREEEGLANHNAAKQDQAAMLRMLAAQLSESANLPIGAVDYEGNIR